MDDQHLRRHLSPSSSDGPWPEQYRQWNQLGTATTAATTITGNAGTIASCCYAEPQQLSVTADDGLAAISFESDHQLNRMSKAGMMAAQHKALSLQHQSSIVHG